MFYSQIPPDERSQWSSDDLSGAIWDEAVDLAGGFSPQSVAALPPGFRFVLAEGLVRAHVEGEGLTTAIWNDDGTHYFRIAAQCFRSANLALEYADFLDRIDALVADWMKSMPEGTTPRSFECKEFLSLPVGQELETRSDELTESAAAAFEPMMIYLRNRPGDFTT
jgi:hypothetical protein